MPFPFSAVCTLLQSLENTLQRKRYQKQSQDIVADWFTQNREALDRHATDKCALLSTLLPERRTDRVFNLKEKRLCSIFAKACRLGYTRLQELRRWETPGSGVDLAECIESILKATPNIPEHDITVEEIDNTLHQLAAGVAFSSPAVRSSRKPGNSHPTAEEVLDRLYRQLSARNAKWLTRLILKTFFPVVVPEDLVYRQCHRLLPSVMKIHDDFAVAVQLLQQQQGRRRVLDSDIDKADLPRLVKPQIGVKVGRQTWLKARSIKHCLELGRGWMSCEEKMDGEYCQIHIDLSKGLDCIQIFSKSSKDSTMDRIKLHPAIRSSLGIGTPSCQFKQRCILEGEMVVFSDKDNKILTFDKIRKHVNRSGRFIGTAEDSQAHDYEHLMIVYFDVLLVDDKSFLNVRHSERFDRLAKLIHCQYGRSALVQRQVINFSSRIAAQELRRAFSYCIVRRKEGLVLKPDEPYFNFGGGRRKYASCCVKLKKGFIKNMGDVGDFAAVGARYDATRAKVLGMPEVKFTHFYIGCLTNRTAVTRFNATPEFTVINEVEMSATMLEQFRRSCFIKDIPFEDNDALILDAPSGTVQGKKISTVFAEPAVFEMSCFSFHKEPNTNSWSLRFPYVSKIHVDRSWKDCLSFDELQDLAEKETRCPEKEDSQELAEWIEALEKADPKRKNVNYDSQSTDITLSTVHSRSTSSQHNITQSPVRPLTARIRAAATAGPSILTPPTSSAVQPPDQPTPERAQWCSQLPQKRRRDISPVSPRRSKHRKGSTGPDASSRNPRSSQRGSRQPLEDITSVPSSQSNMLSEAPVPRLSRLETFHEVPAKVRSSPAPTQLPVSSSVPSPKVVASSPLEQHRNQTSFSSVSRMSSSRPPQGSLDFSPACRYAGRLCALADCLVLLSPCIANMPLLTEDLLPSHEVAAIFTDVPSWLASASLRNSSSRRRQRLVLVERKRVEPTKTFLANLEAEPIRRRNGQSEVVLVYDWRLLEDITAEEKRHRKSDGSGTRQRVGTGALGEEIWRRHYIGACS